MSDQAQLQEYEQVACGSDVKAWERPSKGQREQEFSKKTENGGVIQGSHLLPIIKPQGLPFP